MFRVGTQSYGETKQNYWINCIVGDYSKSHLERGMRSTAIRGWNEYIKLAPGSVLPAPLNRSEVGGIFSVI